MAMSRSFGGTLLTTRSPIRMSPCEICSSPAIIRSSVDFPQPDGPDENDELAVGDVDIHPVDDLHRAEGFADVAKCHWCHLGSFSPVFARKRKIVGGLCVPSADDCTVRKGCQPKRQPPQAGLDGAVTLITTAAKCTAAAATTKRCQIAVWNGSRSQRWNTIPIV